VDDASCSLASEIARAALPLHVLAPPSTWADPAVAVSSAPMMFSSVVLPLPDAPRMTTKAASSMCSDTSSSARVVPNVFVRFDIRSISLALIVQRTMPAPRDSSVTIRCRS
jgi:hypothetical protein